MKPVLVTTEHRGVFFGYVDNDADLSQTTLALKKARMAIRWGTTKGVQQLAAEGVQPNSKIGATCDIPVLHKVTAVFAVSEQAEQSWISA